ncbi:hormone-sensitive lipase [Lentinula edodes]|uniref:Hormone-sensitive lipase n=1 Tax=Lentinula edodes TaxID=5353 RepID=A0A1Q3EAT9_LENED|nr:hormone-sensitive lipase [Lentinula edodes]
MIDHLVGRPSPSWKRAQVFLVIFFWLWRIIRGGSGPPRLFWLKSANRFLQKFTPWQLIVSTLTAVYAMRNFDKILGLESPEPLRSLYSPNYYRATWITTGLDAGMWARGTGKAVLAVDYGKAPEYPYPFAIDEAFDTYQVLVESGGSAIGMSGKKFNVVITSDSAGATLAVNVVLKILEHNNMAHIARKTSMPLPLALVLNYAALDFNFTSWMNEDNLRVLRAEESSGNLPGLRELAKQKDHLKHISPLSMVGDRGSGEIKRHKRIKRNNSWKDTLRGLTTSGSEKEDTSLTSSRKPSLRRMTSGLKTPPGGRIFLRESVENEDSSNDEDEDYTQRKEEDRPLQARVKHVYAHPTPSAAWIKAATEKQEELSAALLEADSEAARAMPFSHADQRKREPIGVRLTMTSRTGYFQDRIISPSMMRAMAILYIGPHRNPDFMTDYHLSPILAPNHLLAQFPPLLMQCGEKDPFVDDTVIFAGRVREAKRARKIELDLAISGKSARFGETLRMSSVDASHAENIAAMKRERDKLARESEDDWVQLVLFAEWSHGYLQMAALIPEAKVVIEDLGEWIDDNSGSRNRHLLDGN